MYCVVSHKLKNINEVEKSSETRDMNDGYNIAL